MNPPLVSLKTVGVCIGLIWIAAHAIAMLRPALVKGWLLRFPRSHAAGLTLVILDFLWTYALVTTMDWGEFYYLRVPVMVALPIFLFLVIWYVDDYLSVRGLGMLGLLAAAPVLDAAFLQPPLSRLLVVVLAYIWVVMGMIWVGQPHVLRDQIGWIERSTVRWQAASVGGLIYGAVVLFCAIAWY